MSDSPLHWPNVAEAANIPALFPTNAPMNRSLTSLSLLLTAALAAGCGASYYRTSADNQVYQILRDRKYDTVGYNPQTVVGEAAVRDGEGATGGPEMAAQVGEGAKPQVVPAPGASAQPAKAYDPIPVTHLPPIEAPALEVPPPAAVWEPLGPWLDESAGGQAPAVPIMKGPNNATPEAGAAVVGAGAGVEGVPLPNEPEPGASRVTPAPYEAAGARADIGPARDKLVLGPPAPGPRPIELDLFGCLAYGVQHSRQYRDQMDALYLAALDVTLQRHLFEPRPFARAGLTYTGGQSSSQYKSALNATLDAGVRQRLPYGGEVVAETLVTFVNAIGDNAQSGESAQLVLSGSIPLLRGAGLVNLDPLIGSERTLVYQIRSFEDFRRSYAVDVATQYFRVVTSLQSVANRQQNVANLIQLREQAQVLFGAPVALRARQSFLEVQRAEQSLLQGRDDLIRAQLTYLNAVDDLKFLLGMDIRQDVGLLPVALDVTVPETESPDVLEVATKYRLDLQTARDRVDDARRQIAITENGLLPDLNLTASGQTGNPVGSPARELSSRALTYSAGVTLDLPVDRLAERNAYRAATINYYASRRNYEDLHDQVLADVRSAVRAIRQAQASVEIQERGIILAQRRLENASTLLRIGQSTSTRDAVEAQSSLLSAQDRFDQARSDLQVQVLQFLRRSGTLRVDPAAGTLGRAMDRSMPPPTAPSPLEPRATSAMLR